jgi:hypothetical protein
MLSLCPNHRDAPLGFYPQLFLTYIPVLHKINNQACFRLCNYAHPEEVKLYLQEKLEEGS